MITVFLAYLLVVGFITGLSLPPDTRTWPDVVAWYVVLALWFVAVPLGWIVTHRKNRLHRRENPGLRVIDVRPHGRREHRRIAA